MHFKGWYESEPRLFLMLGISLIVKHLNGLTNVNIASSTLRYSNISEDSRRMLTELSKSAGIGSKMSIHEGMMHRNTMTRLA